MNAYLDGYAVLQDHTEAEVSDRVPVSWRLIRTDAGLTELDLDRDVTLTTRRRGEQAAVLVAHTGATYRFAYSVMAEGAEYVLHRTNGRSSTP